MSQLVRVLGLAILGIVLIVGAGTTGDTKKDKEKKGSIPSGWKALMLSKEQHDKITAVDVEYGMRIAALQKQMDELKSQRRAEQVKFLTDEQKAILLKGLTGDEKTPAKDAKDKGTPAKDKDK
jgi:hypothetical protein